MRWASTCALDTIVAYQAYLSSTEPGEKRHVEEAEQRVKELTKKLDFDRDESLWQQVCRMNTAEAYQAYLVADLPTKAHVVEARQKILTLQETINVIPREPVSTQPVSKPEPAPPPVWPKFALTGAAVAIALVVWAIMGRPDRIPQETQYPGGDINSSQPSPPPAPNARPADSPNRDRCQLLVERGWQAVQARQFDQALVYAGDAQRLDAQCPGVESLQLQAMRGRDAGTRSGGQAELERQRVRCEALVDAGRDALKSSSYDHAIKSAKKAKQADSQCPGADALERDAVAAKRKAKDETIIF
jgi:hypothetical protein